MQKRTLVVTALAVALCVVVVAVVVLIRDQRDVAPDVRMTESDEVPSEAVAPAAPDAQMTAREDGADELVARSVHDAQLTDFDKVLGSPEAPVTLIEFASLTCGHCADFHNETFPALKQQFVDAGVVRYVYRDFPLDGVALRASMLARCAPEHQFFAVLDTLFQNQRQWISDADPVAALGRIGRLAGMSEEQVEACFSDDALADRIVAQRMAAERQYDISGTPTFVINGQVLGGNQPLERFQTLINDLTAD